MSERLAALPLLTKDELDALLAAVMAKITDAEEVQRRAVRKDIRTSIAEHIRLLESLRTAITETLFQFREAVDQRS